MIPRSLRDLERGITIPYLAEHTEKQHRFPLSTKYPETFLYAFTPVLVYTNFIDTYSRIWYKYY